MTDAGRDLLVEIGTEELPPKNLAGLAEEFCGRLCTLLFEVHGLGTPSGNSHDYYFSPRRLAVIIEGLRVRQADRNTERYGPAIAVAFDRQGRPTRAAEGFARSCGIPVASLEQKDGKLYFRARRPGQAAAALIPDAINEALDKLAIPRRMRWGAGDDEFARPVHWAVVLFGNEVIDCRVLGVRAGRHSRGHRFHHPEPVELNLPRDYPGALRSARVWLNDARRGLQHEISRQACRLAGKVDGEPLNSHPESPLVAEIASLVEWPVPILGEFNPEFLSLPEEVLIATLEGQQRYFPVRAKKTGRLLPYFIAIANIESRDRDRVRQGNERVIRPRLSDAEFFLRRDLRKPLSTYKKELDGVIYQQKLGTLADKTKRVTRLAGAIATMLGGNGTLAKRAGELCKCDLVTEMVGEFPELQGIMGRYYAARSNEPAEVAAALDEQYLPRYAGDRLPATGTGRILAVADKLDTLIGIFAIGQAPTGDKDPFGLRRTALGCLRILIECGLDLDLLKCLQKAARGHAAPLVASDLPARVFDFMMERLRRYYLEADITVDTFEAVLSRRPTRPLDFHQRITAVEAFRKLPEAASLAAANKRIGNILRQADGKISASVNNKLLKETAERQLARELDRVRRKVTPLLDKNDYGTALAELAGLKQKIDTFFDEVLVMCDDAALKKNRLALLNSLHQLFLRTADISRLQN